jgi:DNA-binding transcriptional ArsR family regulator
VLRSPQRAAALLDPGRLRLADALRESPDSAAGLARRLGEKRQTINYHLRALEEAGLVELAEERRRGNCVERVMRVVARQFVLDSAALGPLGVGAPPTGDRFSASHLVAVAARAIREVADLMDRAARERKRMATATLETELRVASPEAFGRFVEDLTAAMADVVSRHDAGAGAGRTLRVAAAVWPGAGGAMGAGGEVEPEVDTGDGAGDALRPVDPGDENEEGA